MASNELVIKIGADSKEFKAEIDKVKSSTEGLEDDLANIARVSAIAFAALTAEIGFAIKSFAESELATAKLTTAMQNQGIYSKELLKSYKDQADALEDLTGIDDDAIVAAQTTLQSYLKQTQVTKELTQAVADLSVAKGIDLNSAAQILGKAIDGNTDTLKRYGIEISGAVTKQERMAAVIREVERAHGGQAEAQTKGLGILRKLANEWDDFQKKLGERLAPVVEKVAELFIRLLKTISNSKPLSDLAASMIVASTAATGLFIATKSLVASTGLGLLLLLATEIYLNWNAIWPRMQATFQAFVNNVTNLAKGIGLVLLGAFSLNKDTIELGLAQIKNAFVQGYTEYGQIVTEKMKEQAAAERAIEAAKQAENQAAVQEKKDADMEDRRIAYESMLAQNEEFQALDAQQQALFRQQNDQKNIENQNTRKSAARLFAQQQLQEQQAANTMFLLEQQKFGTAYATINQGMHSSVYQGYKTAVGELSQLTRSSNQGLKEAGKAFAVAQITMKTAESAMAIFAGFQSLPFGLGIPLGIAAAGLAVAFGADQINQVVSAASGGIITGGIAGRDSVPAMLMPGELVVPQKNFSEVINAVAAARAQDSPQASSGVAVAGGGGGAQMVSVAISLEGDEAERVLTARQVEAQALGTWRSS